MACGTDVQKGQTAIVPNDEWVEPIRASGLVQWYSNGEFAMEDGDVCRIEAGGSVVILGIEQGMALLQYTAPHRQRGTTCPSHAMFLKSLTEVAKMTEAFEENTANRDAQMKLVDRILTGR
jgi:hypothetical protein